MKVKEKKKLIFHPHSLNNEYFNYLLLRILYKVIILGGNYYKADLFLAGV